MTYLPRVIGGADDDDDNEGKSSDLPSDREEIDTSASSNGAHQRNIKWIVVIKRKVSLNEGRLPTSSHPNCSSSAPSTSSTSSSNTFTATSTDRKVNLEFLVLLLVNIRIVGLQRVLILQYIDGSCVQSESYYYSKAFGVPHCLIMDTNLVNNESQGQAFLFFTHIMVSTKVTEYMKTSINKPRQYINIWRVTISIYTSPRFDRFRSTGTSNDHYSTCGG